MMGVLVGPPVYGEEMGHGRNWAKAGFDRGTAAKSRVSGEPACHLELHLPALFGHPYAHAQVRRPVRFYRGFGLSA